MKIVSVSLSRELFMLQLLMNFLDFLTLLHHSPHQSTTIIEFLLIDSLSLIPGSIMFHVRRRPADPQPRRRKKKPLGISNGGGNMTTEREGPVLIEITHSGDGGRRLKLTTEPVEVGSANTNALQLFGPSIQPRHCLISLHEGVCTVTPLHADGLTFVNGHHITQPTILHVSFDRIY